MFDDDFLVLINSWWEPLGFVLPHPPRRALACRDRQPRSRRPRRVDPTPRRRSSHRRPPLDRRAPQHGRRRWQPRLIDSSGKGSGVGSWPGRSWARALHDQEGEVSVPPPSSTPSPLSATTVARIVRYTCSSSRIRGSNGSTIDLPAGREYLGGPSAAGAAPDRVPRDRQHRAIALPRTGCRQVCLRMAHPRRHPGRMARGLLPSRTVDVVRPWAGGLQVTVGAACTHESGAWSGPCHDEPERTAGVIR